MAIALFTECRLNGEVNQPAACDVPGRSPQTRLPVEIICVCTDYGDLVTVVKWLRVRHSGFAYCGMDLGPLMQIIVEDSDETLRWAEKLESALDSLRNPPGQWHPGEAPALGARQQRPDLDGLPESWPRRSNPGT